MLRSGKGGTGRTSERKEGRGGGQLELPCVPLPPFASRPLRRETNAPLSACCKREREEREGSRREKGSGRFGKEEREGKGRVAG